MKRHMYMISQSVKKFAGIADKQVKLKPFVFTQWRARLNMTTRNTKLS